jgi:23S rRNA pseudouridine1911/1915/1917 synthase
MIPPPVLFEDEHLIAVDKPAGLVVHPSYKNLDGTLLDWLVARAHDWPNGERPSIVGRLDKLTSGIVLVAKSAGAHARLQRAMASRDAEKIYLAVVRGCPPAEGVIDLPLKSDPADRRRRTAAPDGAPSLTEFERLAATYGDRDVPVTALLRCRLRTGRRHQIRVHLATRGWPILGDPIYGDALADFPRLALHASRIAFMHPFTQTRVAIEAPLPQDFESLLYSSFAATTIGRLASADFQFSKNCS